MDSSSLEWLYHNPAESGRTSAQGSGDVLALPRREKLRVYRLLAGRAERVRSLQGGRAGMAMGSMRNYESERSPQRSDAPGEEPTKPTKPPAGRKGRDPLSSQGTLPFEKNETNEKRVSEPARGPEKRGVSRARFKAWVASLGESPGERPPPNDYLPDSEGPGCRCMRCGVHYGTEAGWRAHLRSRCIGTETK